MDDWLDDLGEVRVGPLLRAVRERRGLTLQEVADRVGCAKSYLSALETERRNLPGDETLEKIEAALGLERGRLVRTANWQKSLEAGGAGVRKELEAMRKRDAAARELAKLLKIGVSVGEGTQRAHADPARSGGGQRPLDAAYLSGELSRLVDRIAPAEASARSDAIPVPLPMEVPLINSVAAGYPTEFTDLGYPARVADEYVRCPDVHDPDAFAARVVGDSMEPAYVEGDIVIFSPAKALASGQDCFARIEPDQTSTFKRVFFEKDARGEEVIRLQPLNSRYAPTVYPREQVAGLYAAVSVMRRIA
jgi:phage repressor protein C with HTH and peptisase S24 domain/DNA-binding XRE family transcriptional regulator